jgi:tRNA threonylcarbamoyladenosine biosynthesis protein TsaB
MRCIVAHTDYRILNTQTMLILAVDTSGREGSVALARGDADSFDVLELVVIAGGTYSAQLIPSIDGALKRQGLDKSAIEGFAVASGPGSFTGLRVGIAGIKGLAEILRKPIASVSVLEAIALAANADGRVIAATDAARKEVFVGEYDVLGSNAECVRESLMPQPDFLRFLDANPAAHLITPDMDIAELAQFHLHVMHTDRPKADEYARLGLQMIAAGRTTAAEALEANYIRRSDAELLLKPGR